MHLLYQILKLKINNSLRSQAEPDYVDEIQFCRRKEIEKPKSKGKRRALWKALEIIRSEGKASTSFLQRKLQIGYNRAARI